MAGLARRWSVAISLAALLWSSPGVCASHHDLVLGVFPRFDAASVTSMFAPLADYLSGKLGYRVQLETSKDFASFWQGVVEQHYDIVHFNQYHYVRAHALYGYDAILCNVEGGEQSLAGALFTRRDSAVKRLTDLRGKRILFGGGTDAMMSYIVPLELLRDAGVRPWEYRPLFAVNPSNALVGVYFEQADAAGAGTAAPAAPKVSRIVDISQMRVLARSKPLLQLPWAVRSDMPEELRERIQTLLVHLDGTDEGRRLLSTAGLSALRPARDEDYDPHRRIISRVLGEIY